MSALSIHLHICIHKTRFRRVPSLRQPWRKPVCKEMNAMQPKANISMSLLLAPETSLNIWPLSLSLYAKIESVATEITCRSATKWGTVHFVSCCAMRLLLPTTCMVHRITRWPVEPSWKLRQNALGKADAVYIRIRQFWSFDSIQKLAKASCRYVLIITLLRMLPQYLGPSEVHNITYINQ